MPVQYLVLGGAVRTNFLVGETDGQTDRTKTIRVYVSLRIKWKTKNTILLGTVPESNRKIVEIGTLYTPNTEIRRPLTFLAWYNHFYQCGGVKLVLWTHEKRVKLSYIKYETTFFHTGSEHDSIHYYTDYICIFLNTELF
jgi:hypothetical protein